MGALAGSRGVGSFDPPGEVRFWGWVVLQLTPKVSGAEYGYFQAKIGLVGRKTHPHAPLRLTNAPPPPGPSLAEPPAPELPCPSAAEALELLEEAWQRWAAASQCVGWPGGGGLVCRAVATCSPKPEL